MDQTDAAPRAHFAHLPRRGAVRVAGPDARAFLNGLVTCDMARVGPETARFGALLSPQGKILFDFIIVAVPEVDGGGFVLDAPRALAPDLARRLGFYRLRADVSLTDISEATAIVAFWDGSVAPSEDIGLLYRDPRHAGMGYRAMVEPSAMADLAARIDAVAEPESAYGAHRIRHGVPEGGTDFAYQDAFPHEANMDWLHGVDFDKGCYVGQEVVSRMEHRGTARTRILPVAYPAGIGPEPGAEIRAGERVIGRAGASVGGQGLALVRTDRLADARAAGTALMAGGLTVVANTEYA